MKKHLAALLPAFLWLCGCEGGSAICNALNKCGAAPPRCELYFDALILPEGCEDAIVAADCLDHREDPPSYKDLCFPPCEDDSAVCTGDIITACYDGKTTTSKCPQTCKLNGSTYSGVCSNEHEGQMSENGQDVCWCE
jgi:hypothetical protein